MKSLFFLLGSLLLCGSASAQAPQAFNYQGIARDAAGSPLVSQNISLRITILEGPSPESEIYQEQHAVLTNKSGVFSLEVGRGTSQIGQFADISWGSGDHSIQIEMDPDGGSNFTLLGESQLLSVPYALYAGNGTGGTSPWQLNARGIHYDNGFVGIGTNLPQHRLSIGGNDDTGEARTYLNLHNTSTSGRSLVSIDLTAGPSQTYTTVQHISDTYDYEGDKFSGFGQLESSGRGVIIRASKSDGMIKFLAGGNVLSPVERMRITGDGYIGIGTSTPDCKLDVEGSNDTGAGRTYLRLHNQSTSNRSFVSLDLSAGQTHATTTLQHLAPSYDYEGEKFSDFGQLESSGSGVILRASRTDGMIKFMAGGTPLSPAERMRITGEGYIGIGTEKPAAKLQVTDGDVFIEDINKGVIMKSPDGQCWRLTMNNDGTLQSTLITCPN